MTINVGFIGVGQIAQEHLKNVTGSGIARVAAVCDIDEETAVKNAERFGVRPYFDYQSMIESEQLDAVFICVPPYNHGLMERDIARRGIHMLVEKPLGLDMAVVEENRKIIEASGIICGTGYCLRYWDVVQMAKEYLKDKQVAMVIGYYTTRFVGTPWWREMDKSGGQLVEQSTHTVDLVRYFGGNVTQVQSYMSMAAEHPEGNVDIPDVGVVNVQFQSGAVGTIYTTYLQPDHRSGVDIFGPGFRVSVDGGTLTIVEADQTIIRKARNNFYETQDLAFLKAVQTGDTSGILVPYAEAQRTLALTLAANESAQRGGVVKLG